MKAWLLLPPPLLLLPLPPPLLLLLLPPPLLLPLLLLLMLLQCALSSIERRSASASLRCLSSCEGVSAAGGELRLRARWRFA